MSTLFAPSQFYQSWVNALRVKTIKGALLSGIAAVLGDLAVDWGRQANLESLAEYANDPQSVALIGAERQINRGPFESDADYAHRITYAVPQWKLAGTPLGMLVALYYAGFAGAVILQINGRGFSLTSPPVLDDIAAVSSVGAPSWFSVVDLSATGEPYTGTLTIPAGKPWLAYDFANTFTSRFIVLLTDPVATFFRTCATATFAASDTAQVTWSLPMESASYNVLIGPVVTSGGPVMVNADPSTQTTTGVTLRASAAFDGTVDLMAHPAGANPYAWLRSYDLARLRSVIAKWKPAKAMPLSVNAQVMGNVWGWPVRAFGSGELFQAAHIERFSP